MRDRRADVFIQVKGGHFGPIDSFLENQAAEHLKLGSACGDDDVCFAVFLDGIADQLRS